jgi:hypothetical protein
MQTVVVANRSHWEVDKLHARPLGESMAIVDCEVTEIVPFGPREVRMPLHETDVFVLQGDRWLFKEHAETHALDSPKVITPDARLLDDYVGSYEPWPGYIETITRKGDQLYGQATGDSEAGPLRAASDESFFVEGEPGLIVFVRVDSSEMPAVDCPEPDGLSFVLLARLLGDLLRSPRCAGMEVTIYDPDLDVRGEIADRVVQCLVDAFRERTALNDNNLSKNA